MKIAVVTMVYRDYWALARWFDHFSKMVGAEHLYVISHGSDDRISEICPGANVTTIPRDDLTGFDRNRWQFLNLYRDALNCIYDHVIRTDADELICLDPNRFSSIQDVFRQHEAPALFALGLDVVQVENAHWAVFNGHYSKAWVSWSKIPMVLHGVRVQADRLTSFPFVMPRGVYLVHIKYANAEALRRSNQHRMEIARQDGLGLPGPSWRSALTKANEMLTRVDRLQETFWDAAADEAYLDLSQNPKRDEKTRVIRARFERVEKKCKPPSWIFRSD